MEVREKRVGKSRFWGAVAKDGSHIREVQKADGKDMAETLLFNNWTSALREMYEVKPVTVTVDADSDANGN